MTNKQALVMKIRIQRVWLVRLLSLFLAVLVEIRAIDLEMGKRIISWSAPRILQFKLVQIKSHQGKR